MAKVVINSTDSPKDSRTPINNNFTELYTGANVVAATEKTTPVDADKIPIQNSADSNLLYWFSWANLKATLKTYFDTLYTKCTGAEITTGTDDVKFATPKALADATVGKLGAAWASWSPSYANLTVGAGGAVVAKYVQIGKTIHFKFKFTWGTGSGFSAGSNITISFPVASTSDYLQYGGIGKVTCYDASGTYYIGEVAWISTTTMTPYGYTVPGAYFTLQQINNTTPFTWATGDVLWIEGTYEVA